MLWHIENALAELRAHQAFMPGFNPEKDAEENDLLGWTLDGQMRLR